MCVEVYSMAFTGVCEGVGDLRKGNIPWVEVVHLINALSNIAAVMRSVKLVRAIDDTRHSQLVGVYDRAKYWIPKDHYLICLWWLVPYRARENVMQFM